MDYESLPLRTSTTENGICIMKCQEIQQRLNEVINFLKSHGNPYLKQNYYKLHSFITKVWTSPDITPHFYTFITTLKFTTKYFEMRV